MSRTDSFAGLSARATEMINGARRTGTRLHEGLCNEFPLGTYTANDGRTLQEVIQVDVWSGGPTWFTTLVETAGESHKPIVDADWTEQEIADRMDESYGEAVPAIRACDVKFFETFADAISSGRMSLGGGEAEKYQRWRASKVQEESSAANELPAVAGSVR